MKEMAINTQSRNAFHAKIYWIMTLLIFAFVANNDEKFAGELLVHYIPGTKWLVHIAFLVLFTAVSLVFVRKVLVDKIEVILFLKLIVDIISTCVINEPESIAFIIWADIGVLTYFICRNESVELKNLLNIYESFALVLSVQTIVAGMLLLQNGISFDSVIFKSQLRIPFAGSNLIADIISSALLCTFARYDVNETKKAYFIAKTLIYVIASLFIRSRGSIIALLVVLDWTILKRIRSVNGNFKRILFYIMLATINLIVIVYSLNSAIVESYFSRYLDASSDITSGRLQIWQFAWDEFTKHPIFGRGISFTADIFQQYTGAHNIWLDTLMSSGIFGFIFHLLAIGMIAYELRLYRRRGGTSDKTVFACSVILLFLYLDSMFEVSYYNYINDVIFWSLSGFLISEISSSDSLLIERDNRNNHSICKITDMSKSAGKKDNW